MNESKISLTDRLRRENRWAEATQFKDAHAKQLRDSGERRGPAIEAAWTAMELQFPPLEIPETPEEDELALIPEGISAGNLKDFATDAGWTYSNLLSGDDYTEEPPSTGALSLLVWARKNTTVFYGNLLPKALALLEKKPDTAEEAKQANLLHAKTLRERTSHLLDIP